MPSVPSAIGPISPPTSGAIPILLTLGAWRHLLERIPLIYEHDYWAAVFPLGMYAVCTQSVIRVFSLPLLEPIATVFVWVALGAWALTFVGLARYALMACPSRYEVRLRRRPQ